jgi:16S rRNA (cytosine967-C5)-methyltransferase
MKTDKPRALSLDTLISLEKAGEYTGNYLEEIFSKNPGFDERDRGFIANLIQGVIRYRLRLDYIIGGFSKTPLNKIDNRVLNILRLAIYQIYFMDRVPESAAVDRAVEQAKAIKGHEHIVPFVNGILRNLCRNKDGVKFPDRKKATAKYLSSFYSFPLWLAERCLDEKGLADTEALFEAQNRFPSINIRVNRLKTSAEELVKVLKDEGVEAVPAEYIPDCLILTNFSGRIERLASFKKGLFQVQDQAAQAVSWLLDIKPGQTVLDVCAGLGGKSSHLMELMGGKGSVTAIDTDKRKLEMLHENARRLGLTNIKTVVADASLPFPDNLKGSLFDRVLIDAPCSGLGTIGRHPDIKWNRTEIDIKRISRVQRKILENAAEAAKPGGLILYAVCTYTREENRVVVDNFIKKNSMVSLVDMSMVVPEWARNLIDNEGFFRSYPHKHKMDGFFGALMRKK